MTAAALLTLTTLRDRGWTPALIAAFLGEPDALRRNPHYAKAAPMRLYALARVEAAEAAPEFAHAREKAQARSGSAKKAAETQRAKLLRQIAEFEVEVEVLPVPEVRRLAIEAYNDWTGYNDWIEREPATAHSDPEFLERITVNFVRHRLTAYDGHLEEVAGRIGVSEAVPAIRRKVFAAIAAAYPGFAEECERQQQAREALESLRRALPSEPTAQQPAELR